MNNMAALPDMNTQTEMCSNGNNAHHRSQQLRGRWSSAEQALCFTLGLGLLHALPGLI